MLNIAWSPIRDWLYFNLLRIFHIFHFEINITVFKMTSKSSPPNSPNIIFDSLLSILAVNLDLLKYNQSRIGDQAIFNTWKNNFKQHLQYTLHLLILMDKFLNVLFSNIFLISYWKTLSSINTSPEICADTLPCTNLLKFTTIFAYH
jgi:hypothetical protein